MTKEANKTDTPLEGRRVLVADDEFLIAVVIEESLQDAGAEVISAATLAATLKATEEHDLSAAVLDVRLGHQTTERAAEILSAKNVPLVFYSGQELPQAMRIKFPSAKVLIKPLHQSAIIAAIVNVIGH
jgi:DNA-binding response OmpR family regulator